MRELLAHRDFRLLLGAQTLSMAGDWALLLVFGIWTKTVTGSDSLAALTLFAMAAPALLSPIGAVFVDRFPRRFVIAGISAVSAAVLLLLWLVRGPDQVWLLASVAVWIGFSGVLLNAAVTALLQDLLPPALLGRANSALATVRQGLRLGAPLLGAGLFATLGGAVVATIDAATFLLSGALILLLRSSETQHDRSGAAFRQDLLAGIRQVGRVPVLRRYLLVSILVFVGFGLIDAAIFALVDLLQRPPTFISVLVAVQGAAALLSGSAATLAAARLRPAALGLLGAALATLALALLATASLPLVFLGFVLLGAAQPPFGVASITLLQLHTSGALIGRASTAFDAASSTAYTAMIGVGALLIIRVPAPWVLAGSAIGCLAATFVAISASRLPDSSGASGRRADGTVVVGRPDADS